MQNGALSDYAEADNTRNTGPNHSNIASVLGMSVSTVAVICHTSVTAYVTGSNLAKKNGTARQPVGCRRGLASAAARRRGRVPLHVA